LLSRESPRKATAYQRRFWRSAVSLATLTDSRRRLPPRHDTVPVVLEAGEQGTAVPAHLAKVPLTAHGIQLLP